MGVLQKKVKNQKPVVGSVHFLMGFVGGVGGDAIRNSAQRSSLFPTERVLVSGMCGALPFVPSCAESKIVHAGCIPDVSIPKKKKKKKKKKNPWCLSPFKKKKKKKK